MLFNAHKSFPVHERSYINPTKKDISKLAESIGFTEEQRGKIEIIVTELCTNLIKHQTVGGELLVKKIDQDGRGGIEIISVDNGPGMHDVKRMLEDGVSTYGSKGEGLGAIKRLSDFFDIYTVAGVGTYILSRMYVKQRVNDSPLKPRKNLDIKVVMLPKQGETLCGDGWAEVESGNQVVLMASDGLGHGLEAHNASEEAIKVFRNCFNCIPSDILRAIHSSIKRTRGIVAGVATINFANETLSYCGIGNIGGRIISRDNSKSLISYNGTIGHNIPNTFNNHTFKWDSSHMLILHSDGIKSRWDLLKYPGIERHDSSIIAAAIYKDNTRKTDDVLVMVVRNKQHSYERNN